MIAPTPAQLVMPNRPRCLSGHIKGSSRSNPIKQSIVSVPSCLVLPWEVVAASLIRSKGAQGGGIFGSAHNGAYCLCFCPLFLLPTAAPLLVCGLRVVLMRWLDRRPTMLFGGRGRLSGAGWWPRVVAAVKSQAAAPGLLAGLLRFADFRRARHSRAACLPVCAAARPSEGRPGLFDWIDRTRGCVDRSIGVPANFGRTVTRPPHLDPPPHTR